LRAGEFVAIAGPNGAGKSTLLNVIAGIHRPSSGACLFLERPAADWNRRDFARRVAVVQQTDSGAFPFLASEIVRMGRAPHSNGFYESAADEAAVAHAVALADVGEFLHRNFQTLSGGERQRVLLASALAQEPGILLLDEPANHLDLQHQIDVHRLLRDLGARDLLIVTVTHDLNLAAAYAGRLIVLKDGIILADGHPSEVIRPDLVESVFHIQPEIHIRPNGQPWLLYGD
jgi:iron complex transport system ATP-binding protein